jgi:transposase
MKKISMIGLDLAKNVFQVHCLDESGVVVLQRQLRRAQLEGFFAKHAPAVVGLEACSGAHHWARVLQGMGHEVRMMAPGYVKPYVKRNKTDSRDAEAICEAMQRPTMRFVQIKSVESQAVLMLHRTRSLLVRQRTMATNALRAGCAEFGLVAAQGFKGLHELLRQVMDPAAGAIPALAKAALTPLARQWQALDDDIRALEARIVRAVREDIDARRLIEVPSVGPITASAATATIVDPHLFRCGRDFAAWVGLTPRQNGTGGKTRSGGISKKGDRTLRTLLIIGASSVLRQAKARGSNDPWITAMLARRPFKVVAVALAARTARIIWALMAKGGSYRNRAATVAAA